MRLEVGYRQHNVANSHRLKRKSICAGGVDQMIRVRIFSIEADGNAGKVKVYFLSSRAMQLFSVGRQQAKLTKFFPNIFIFPYRFHRAASVCISMVSLRNKNSSMVGPCPDLQYFLCVASLLLIRRPISEIILGGFLFFTVMVFVGASSSKAV